MFGCCATHFKCTLLLMPYSRNRCKWGESCVPVAAAETYLWWGFCILIACAVMDKCNAKGKIWSRTCEIERYCWWRSSNVALNFVFVTKPRVILTCMERNGAILCVHILVFAFHLSMTVLQHLCDDKLGERPLFSLVVALCIVDKQIHAIMFLKALDICIARAWY